MRILAPFLLVGCMPGPNEETVIDELRVVASVLDAPEVRPSERTTVTVTVADPHERGAEVLVWSCSALGCGDIAWGPVTDEQFVAEVGAPALDATDEPQPLVTVSALACEPGLCPIIDAAKAGEPWVADALAYPDVWLSELPFEGVSLGQRALRVSTRDVRHVNPTLEIGDLQPPEPEAAVPVPFSVSGLVGDGEIFPYATRGGFERLGVDVDEGELSWYAPEDAGPVRLYAVLTDQLGGTAVWRGTIDVQ